MEIIQERKRVLIEEEASGVKGAAGKDLLTLLIRANVHDKDGGMSDEAVLARESSSRFRGSGWLIGFTSATFFF